MLMLASGYSGFGTGSSRKREPESTRAGKPDQFFSEGNDTETVWSGARSGLNSGGGHQSAATAKADTKRVQHVIFAVPAMMKAKTPIDSLMCILKMLKTAMGKACQKLTVFILDKTLQKLIFTGT